MSSRTSRTAAAHRARCQTRRDDGRFVITVSGELDGASASSSEFEAALAAYRTDEPVDVALELGDVVFIDSPGLSWLMSVRSAAAMADRKVRLRSSSPAVERVLVLGGLRRYFPDEG